MMNKLQVMSQMKKIGLVVHFSRTGHPDFERGYVATPQVPEGHSQGCTYGRITMFAGQYDHIKWYCDNNTNPEFIDADYYINAWDCLLKTGKVLPRERWEELCTLAHHLNQNHLDEKQAWRDNNPKKGANQKRKSLKLGNPRRFMADLIFNAMEQDMKLYESVIAALCEKRREMLQLNSSEMIDHIKMEEDFYMELKSEMDIHKYMIAQYTVVNGYPELVEMFAGYPIKRVENGSIGKVPFKIVSKGSWKTY